MKKNMKSMAILISTALLLTACGGQQTSERAEVTEKINIEDAIEIQLSDESITVDGTEITEADTDAVYKANDIVYYEAGHDFTYGEGTEDEEHTEDKAKEHTVVHITEPGMYALSGRLSKGQIAIDLGEDAEEDPEAVVTLVLNNVDINCDVAPSVIFYNVYECGSTEEADASNTVDTTAAGANVYIPDKTVNNITGSHVARIYESYELNDEGTEVVDSEKLHKYDGAFYSKMSMNVDGAENGSGILNITADNEGLDSELHLTVNGGNINITSGNDGINTNEDGISVTTINDGSINIHVTGTTGEGDGIDSNGWLVINGGTVVAEACSTSGDAGIDSDMGIHINGGNVMASGNMLDRIGESGQNYVVMSFAESQKAGETYTLKDEKEEAVATATPGNDFTYLILSNADITEGSYTFWQDDTQLSGMSGQMMGGGNMQMPENGEAPEMPEGMEMPENGEAPEMPEGMEMPENGEAPEMPERMEMPENGEAPEMPEGMEMPEDRETPEKPEGTEMPEGAGNMQGGGRGGRGQMNAEMSKEFAISANGNYYSNVTAADNE